MSAPHPSYWLHTLSEVWPLAAVLVGHLIRTETTRAILRRDVDSLAEMRRDDIRRLDARLDEISKDIKSLLARYGSH